MAPLAQPLLADALVNGMALFSVALVGYLFWLRYCEGRKRRKLQRERQRDPRKQWGYE